MPLVSIIIPVYNTEKYLKRCLDSVVNQTYKNIEIIIINDASRDNSKNILEEYAKTYKNIKVMNNPSNLGVGASRNKGLEQANGDYICFLDSDDSLKETAINIFVTLALKYNAQLVEAKSKTIFKQNIKKEKDTPVTITQIDIEKNKEYLLTEKGAVWNKLYARSIVEEEKFPKNLIFEDAAFLYPILTKVKRSILTNEVLHFYYRHKGSITLSNKMIPNEKIVDIYPICELIKERCQILGTYTSYERILEEIIKTNYLYVLLEADTWIPLGFKKQMLLLNLLKQYTEQKYDYHHLISAQVIKNRAEKDILYRARIILLNEHLELAKNLYPTISYEPLEDAKRIIAKYKR